MNQRSFVGQLVGDVRERVNEYFVAGSSNFLVREISAGGIFVASLRLPVREGAL